MSQTNILNYDTTPNTNILFCKLVLLFSKNDFELSKRSHKISFKFQLSSGNGVNYKHLITVSYYSPTFPSVLKSEIIYSKTNLFQTLQQIA